MTSPQDFASSKAKIIIAANPHPHPPAIWIWHTSVVTPPTSPLLSGLSLVGTLLALEFASTQLCVAVSVARLLTMMVGLSLAGAAVVLGYKGTYQ